MSSSSSAHHRGGATSAPPPTPSSHPTSLLSSAATPDSLSLLLHRHLPPSLSLSLPTLRRSPAATCPPLLSLSLSADDASLLSLLASSSSQLGFFQLTDHSLPSQLARSAESAALSILSLSREEKGSLFPNHWPLGYEPADEDGGELICLDSAESTESTPLIELSRELERVGLRIVELLARVVGFERPERLCALTWISENSPEKKPVGSVGFYPFAVGLEYQIRERKYSLLSDSGWVSVVPRVDSVLVTIGDIAQVWSNGKLKKVRGRPVPNSGDDNINIIQGINDNKNSRSISMSVLITLPLDSMVSPLIVFKESNICDHINLDDALQVINEEEEISSENKVKENGDEDSPDEKEKRLFETFSFEDYAWRVYHERLPLKDPLDRYRIKN